MLVLLTMCIKWCGLLRAVYLCNDLDAYSEKVLGSSIVDCFWAIVGHGIVAHQHKVVLCVS